MVRPAPIDIDEETIPVPGTVRFPVELTPPEGFDPARLETWPRVEGRLEWVGGRLLYMPPCGDRQQYTVADVVATLVNWVRSHPRVRRGHQRSRHATRRRLAGRRRGDLAPRQGGHLRRRLPASASGACGRGRRPRRGRARAARQGAVVPGRRGRDRVARAARAARGR